MVRTKTTWPVLLLTATLVVAGPALAEADPAEDGPVPCVTITLAPPDAHVDKECIEDLIPPPPTTPTDR